MAADAVLALPAQQDLLAAALEEQQDLPDALVALVPQLALAAWAFTGDTLTNVFVVAS